MYFLITVKELYAKIVSIYLQRAYTIYHQALKKTYNSNIQLIYYSNRGLVFCQSLFNFHCCESERQLTVNPIMKNTSFIKVPFPSLIVHRYCMWGGPQVVFIAIYVGGGPPENRDHVTGAES